MKKIFFVMLVCLTGCEALPFVGNAATFGAGQYFASERHGEVVGKIDGVEKKIDLILVHEEIDTGALTGSTDAGAPESDESFLIGLGGLAGLIGLMGAAWPFIRKAGTAYAKTQGIESEKINEIADKIEKAVKRKR